MKFLETLAVLLIAASFTSISFAASEPATPPVPVPKNAAAMQATAAVTAKDAAQDSVKPTAKKSKDKHKKVKTVEKHKAKGPHVPLRSAK